MGCLKCGADTAKDQVFCDACQEEMKQYPVKPDTPVQLLPREAVIQELRVEEPLPETTLSQQLAQLRGVIRGLVAIIAILSVLLCATAVLLIRTLNQDTPVSNIGKNYTTDVQQAP